MTPASIAMSRTGAPGSVARRPPRTMRSSAVNDVMGTGRIPTATTAASTRRSLATRLTSPNIAGSAGSVPACPHGPTGRLGWFRNHGRLRAIRAPILWRAAPATQLLQHVTCGCAHLGGGSVRWIL